MKTEVWLGIDLGTSSVKVMAVTEREILARSRAAYEEISPEGWWKALAESVHAIPAEVRGKVTAIGLSSQVGTYLAYGKERQLLQLLHWNGSEGSEELARIRRETGPEVFLQEIGMEHPSLISYPLPRLLWLKRKYGELTAVCQPKDYLVERMTGKFVSDRWSWRGLAHPERNSYSKALLEQFGLEKSRLPELVREDAVAGTLLPDQADLLGLPEGTEVVTGMNDFYAGLLGMGITGIGQRFDVTGTSEHFGCIREHVARGTAMVSGPYLAGCVHYGGTAASGPSLDLARNNFDLDRLEGDWKLDAPVFLPYLGGERAPIFDPEATGVFYGIGRETGKEDLAYAVMEGVVFSLRHIMDQMGAEEGKPVILGGGASRNPMLNQLKADVWNSPVRTLQEKDSSALGASILAGKGRGRAVEDLVRHLVRTEKEYQPSADPEVRRRLGKRYEIYRKLYPALKAGGL